MLFYVEGSNSLLLIAGNKYHRKFNLRGRYGFCKRSGQFGQVDGMLSLGGLLRVFLVLVGRF